MFDSSRSGGSESERKGEEKVRQDSKEFEEKILKKIEEYDMKNYQPLKKEDPKNSIAMTHIFDQKSPRPDDVKKNIKNII